MDGRREIQAEGISPNETFPAEKIARTLKRPVDATVAMATKARLSLECNEFARVG